MSERNQDNSIKKKILNQIKKGEVKMHSRAHFLLRSAFVFFGLVLAVFALIYLVSFIFYFLKQSGTFYLSGFGPRGLFLFLGSFPWMLAILVLFLLVIIEVLSRRYSFSYKTPVLYFILITLLIIVGGSFLVSETGLHPRLQKLSQEKRLCGFGTFYRSRGRSKHSNRVMGKVLEITEDGFYLQDSQDNEFKVVISDKTRVIPDADFEKEDLIMVLGEKENNKIYAFGIRKVKAESFPCPDCLFNHSRKSPHQAPMK